MPGGRLKPTIRARHTTLPGARGWPARDGKATTGRNLSRTDPRGEPGASTPGSLDEPDPFPPGGPKTHWGFSPPGATHRLQCAGHIGGLIVPGVTTANRSSASDFVMRPRSLWPDSRPSPSQMQQRPKLWPAIKGSRTQVRKTCRRPHCKACARGDKQPAFIRSFTRGGQRRRRYGPKVLAPWFERLSGMRWSKATCPCWSRCSTGPGSPKRSAARSKGST